MEFFGKSQIAKDETKEKTATEIINLKITSAQIQSYSETQKMPDLQYLADEFYKDDEIQYVYNKSQKTAAKEPIKVTGEYIYTKLKEYPYEFQIDGNLRLASIDGVKVAETTDSKVEDRLKSLETMVGSLQTTVGSLQTENQELKNKVETLENETIVNKRVKLTQDNFKPLEIALTTQQIDKYYGSILLKESLESYKYLEIQIQAKNTNLTYWGNKTVLLALDSLKYNNSNTLNYGKDTTFTLIVDWAVSSGAAVAVECQLKNEKEIVIGSAATTNASYGALMIKNV